MAIRHCGNVVIIIVIAGYQTFWQCRYYYRHCCLSDILAMSLLLSSLLAIGHCANVVIIIVIDGYQILWQCRYYHRH